MTRSASGKPKILSFCRPYLTRDFKDNLAPVASEYDVSFLTDGRSPGTPDTRREFYAAMRAGRRSSEIDPLAEADVLLRCRLLRNLPRERATAMLHGMAHVLAGELDRVRPRAILCHMVDEYVTHLLALLGQRRGVRFVGYAHSYFPRLLQVTQHAHGNPLHVREPGAEDIEEVYAKISQRVYRQNYQQRGNYTRLRHLKGLARYRVKQLVFGAKGLIERDPWNVHYAITPYIVERRRWRDFPRATDFEPRWQDRLQALRRERARAVVYLPLGYFPESTIDYWVRDTRILRYETITLEMLRVLAARHVVVVKEHLHMMGARDPGFYRAMRAIDGVISVHPMEYSNDVLAEADAVVLGGGSVGVEATIRGKPVLSYCDTTYWFTPSGATLLDLADVSAWPGLIDAAVAAHTPRDSDRVHDFLRACLRSTANSRPGGRRWPLVAESDLRAMLRAAVE